MTVQQPIVKSAFGSIQSKHGFIPPFRNVPSCETDLPYQSFHISAFLTLPPIKKQSNKLTVQVIVKNVTAKYGRFQVRLKLSIKPSNHRSGKDHL